MTYFRPLFWTFGVEISLIWHAGISLFDLLCSIRHKGDHPGFYFFMRIWKAQFEFNIASSEHDVGSLADVKERETDLCRFCGLEESEHTLYTGTPPNYGTSIICPDGQSLFFGLNEDESLRRYRE
jgi:hypothetical protein